MLIKQRTKIRQDHGASFFSRKPRGGAGYHICCSLACSAAAGRGKRLLMSIDYISLDMSIDNGTLPEIPCNFSTWWNWTATRRSTVILKSCSDHARRPYYVGPALKWIVGVRQVHLLSICPFGRMAYGHCISENCEGVKTFHWKLQYGQILPRKAWIVY